MKKNILLILIIILIIIILFSLFKKKEHFQDFTFVPLEENEYIYRSSMKLAKLNGEDIDPILLTTSINELSENELNVFDPNSYNYECDDNCNGIVILKWLNTQGYYQYYAYLISNLTDDIIQYTTDGEERHNQYASGYRKQSITTTQTPSTTTIVPIEYTDNDCINEAIITIKI